MKKVYTALTSKVKMSNTGNNKVEHFPKVEGFLKKGRLPRGGVLKRGSIVVSIVLEITL